MDILFSLTWTEIDRPIRDVRWGNVHKLNGTTFSIHKQFPADIEEKRQ